MQYLPLMIRFCNAENSLILAQVSQIQMAKQVVELCRRFGNHTVKLMAAPPPFPDRNLFGSALAPASCGGGGVNAVQISLSAKSADKTGGGILTRVFCCLAS